MINELYGLSNAMERSGIQAQSWHRKYKPVPNIRANAPCVRIVISAGKVISLSAVQQELGTHLRKFGTNQGSYTWAKSYRAKGIEEKGKESWRANWLYSTCETIMTKLSEKWAPQTKFSDEEKVQLFIGYLAAFSKEEKTEDKQNKAKEEHSNE